MKWQKCRNPVHWSCDNCGCCGGCTDCTSQAMYHKGKECLCASCYSTQIPGLEKDLELLRSFLWDDVDETWPEDVREVLQRAMDRLTGL